MSFRTWHEYGYGIIASYITEIKVDELIKIINSTTDFKKSFYEWMDAIGVTDKTITVENISEYDNGEVWSGLGIILKEIIFELDKIDLYVCEDFDGEQYLMYLPIYPWHMGSMDKNLTEKDIENVITKYVSKITDIKIKVDYQECENGG